MKRISTGIGFALALSLAFASPATAAADRTVEATKGTPQTWQGEKSPGTNANYFGGYVADTPDTPLTPVGTCDKDANSYCDHTLLKINNAITAEEQAAGVVKKTAKVRVAIDWAGTPVLWDNVGANGTDFDLELYASDETGALGEMLGDSTQSDTINETVQITVDTTLAKPSAWLLVRVIYFAVPNQDGYTGNVTFPK